MTRSTRRPTGIYARMSAPTLGTPFKGDQVSAPADKLPVPPTEPVAASTPEVAAPEDTECPFCTETFDAEHAYFCPNPACIQAICIDCAQYHLSRDNRCAFCRTILPDSAVDQPIYGEEYNAEVAAAIAEREQERADFFARNEQLILRLVNATVTAAIERDQQRRQLAAAELEQQRQTLSLAERVHQILNLPAQTPHENPNHIAPPLAQPDGMHYMASRSTAAEHMRQLDAQNNSIAAGQDITHPIVIDDEPSDLTLPDAPPPVTQQSEPPSEAEHISPAQAAVRERRANIHQANRWERAAHRSLTLIPAPWSKRRARGERRHMTESVIEAHRRAYARAAVMELRVTVMQAHRRAKKQEKKARAKARARDVPRAPTPNRGERILIPRSLFRTN